MGQSYESQNRILMVEFNGISIIGEGKSFCECCKFSHDNAWVFKHRRVKSQRGLIALKCCKISIHNLLICSEKNSLFVLGHFSDSLKIL